MDSRTFYRNEDETDKLDLGPSNYSYGVELTHTLSTWGDPGSFSVVMVTLRSLDQVSKETCL